MAKPVKTDLPRPVGRPTLYKPEYCQLLIEHMAEGLSYDCFGAVICVSTQTLYDWELAHPEFLDAKKEAFLKNRLFWESKGVEALGFDKFQATLWIFNMKNRFPKEWRDRTEVVSENKTEHSLSKDTIESIRDEIESARKEKTSKLPSSI